jgi:exodeoxyribonuclease-3
MTPAGPVPDRLRVATWNLNSLRVRLRAVDRFLDRVHPDVLCLQETRASAVSTAAHEVFGRHGYEVAHAGAKGSNGVAVVSRHPISDIVCSGDLDDEHLDREPRVASCVVEGPVTLRVASVYVPHGRKVGHWHYRYKLAFLRSLTEQARRWVLEEPRLVVAGDVNVAQTDSDVFHPDAFVGSTHVSPPERRAVAELLAVGLVDVDAEVWGPRSRRFTWWNYGIGYSRNLGMRIDIIATDRRLAATLDTTWIDHMERATDPPSDHAAVIADFHRGPDAG